MGFQGDFTNFPRGFHKFRIFMSFHGRISTVFPQFFRDFFCSSRLSGTEQGVRPVPGIIRAGMPKDDSDALEALGFSKVEVERQRKRRMTYV